MLFMVVKTLWYVDERDEVETGQVSMFIGADFVVTVRQGEGVELVRRPPRPGAQDPPARARPVRGRLLGLRPDRRRLRGGRLASWRPTSTRSRSRCSPPAAPRTAAGSTSSSARSPSSVAPCCPLRTPMQRFAATSYPYLHEDSGTFFRDIADHVVRVAEAVETLDQLLSTAFEAHLARITVEQNEDMRRISAWVAIAAVGTLVAGIYGMNFERHARAGLALRLRLGAGAHGGARRSCSTGSSRSPAGSEPAPGVSRRRRAPRCRPGRARACPAPPGRSRTAGRTGCVT